MSARLTEAQVKALRKIRVTPEMVEAGCAAAHPNWAIGLEKHKKAPRVWMRAAIKAALRALAPIPAAAARQED